MLHLNRLHVRLTSSLHCCEEGIASRAAAATVSLFIAMAHCEPSQETPPAWGDLDRILGDVTALPPLTQTHARASFILHRNTHTLYFSPRQDPGPWMRRSS